MRSSFTYAVHVNLLNGDHIEEYLTGLTIEARPWTSDDQAQWPQADRQLTADQILLVDRTDGHTYAIACSEAVEQGV